MSYVYIPLEDAKLKQQLEFQNGRFFNVYKSKNRSMGFYLLPCNFHDFDPESFVEV